MSAQLEVAALRLYGARRGQKSKLAKALADELGVSLPTFYKRLERYLPDTGRKRRCDAGETALTRDEARTIAAYMEFTRRDTGHGEAVLEDVVSILRSNGEILAGRVDEATGEFTPLSVSAIRRALKTHGYHPSQLAATPPASRLFSPYPNYCWQIDATVSGQYYLADDGLRVMVTREFYDGKPNNLVRINDRRIWLYTITDHFSGAIEVFYVQGAESANNLISALIYAMTERTDGTMYARPENLMLDPGSAPTSAPVRNFADALGMKLLVHAPGAARVNGQVENAHALVQRHFEANLRVLPPMTTIEQINTLAREWARAFNATRIHTRHGETRRNAWLRIEPSQLVRVPPIDVLRTLANSDPKPCTVRDYMLRFRGRIYDVRDLPGGVLNGQRLMVVRNALASDESSVRVLVKDADGRNVHFLAPEITRRAGGFLSTAAQIGVEFNPPPETAADAARKELDRVAMEVATDEEAKAARKAKKLPFGGRVDPMKPLREVEIPKALPRAGRTVEVAAPLVVEPQPIPTIRPQYAARQLGVLELAQAIKRRFDDAGIAWTPGHYARLSEGWPNGAGENQLDQVFAALQRGGLRAIGGGAA